MHSSVRWLTAGLLVSLTFACSARGGGGGFIDPDAATGSDAGPSPMDSTGPSPDTGKPPVDVGFINDLTTPPTDNGLPPVDTGVPARCGDGLCTSGETCTSCSQDCGACPARCGDGACQSSESCTSCSQDCGACPTSCGDGTCQSSESCTTCSPDCGACPPRCGDGSCNGTDTCSNCPADCGACAPSCGSITSCTACAADTRCGWCTFPGACEAGNSSGPTGGSSFCPVLGTWVRSASACSPPDAGTADITAACGSTSTGTSAQCGWRLERTITCTSGNSVLVGCTPPAGDAGTGVNSCPTPLGSSLGDPMIRVCAGSGPCTTGLTLAPTASAASGANAADDGCGVGPLGRFTCPAAGVVTVYWRAYDYANQSSTRCMLGRS